jgi:hypothetical protein
MAELTTRTVEIFYGGQWHDITADTKEEDPAQTTRGIANEGGSADAGSLGLTLWNGESNVNPAVSNRYATRNPLSDLFGLIGPNTPVRLSAGLVGDTPTVRTVQEVASWPPRWDVSERDRWVPLQAAGVLRRLGVASSPVQSALRRYFLAMRERLHAYLPLEDGTDTRRTTNLVPSQTGIAYVAPRPEFAQDATLLGSDPLPEWPVSGYFGWGTGGSVAPHGPPWAVYVVFRAPAGSGECWLCEWKTDGEDTDWSLKISSGGKLQVVTDNDGATGVTHTSTAANVDDGEWQLGGVVVYNDPDSPGTQIVELLARGSWEAFASGAPVGRVTRIRPRPLFASPSGKDPVGLGHMAVASDPNHFKLIQPTFDLAPGVVSPIEGWAGETALDRTERLCLDEGLSLTFGARVAVDTFDRTESSGWGTGWTTSGGDAADYAVSPGEATIDVDTLESGRECILAVSVQDFDKTVLVRVADVLTGGPGDLMFAAIVARALDANNRYSFSGRFFTGGTVSGSISATVGGIATLLALTGVDGSVAYDDTTVIAIRAQGRGSVLRMKLWDAAGPQPSNWSGEAVDSSLLAAGAVGVRTSLTAGITNTLPVTLAVSGVSVGTAPESAMMGPQQPGEFLGVLGECAKVEAAGSRAPILVEQQAAAGLHFNALTSLYLPRTADLTLDWAEAHVSPPFEVTPDDFGLANDVTAGRPDGGEHRTVITTGPRGVTSAGRVAKRELFEVASDVQLASVSGWWAWHGTWDEDRYPTIRINMRSLSLRADGAALLAAVQALTEGALIVIANPPAGMPAEQIEQIVLGITETITVDEWLIDLHTTAARPFLVAVIGDQTYGITGSDSTTLGEALDTTETGVDIDCGAGDDWVHEGVDYDIKIGGERMTVTAAGAASGAFPNRTQTLTVVRSVNGIVKAHATAAPVEMWHQTVIGPWG